MGPQPSGSYLNCLATIFLLSFAMVSYSLWVFSFSGLMLHRLSTSKISPQYHKLLKLIKDASLFFASYVGID